MKRNWMIRTRTKHLLGPISKDKLLELIENGSIHEDDELCSGNGYWFNLREKALLQKYVYSDVEQSFNPVSEALNEIRLREQQGISLAAFDAQPATDDDEEITRSISIDEIKAEAAEKKKKESPFPAGKEENTDTDLGLLNDLQSPDILKESK